MNKTKCLKSCPVVRNRWRHVALAAGLSLAVAGRVVGDEPKSNAVDQRAAHLARMTEIAAGFQIYPTPQRQVAVELFRTPVLRYTDDTREQDEASLWIWGPSGRPHAIMAIEYYTKGPRGPRWLFEIASLSTERISVKRGKDVDWTATEPGLKLQTLPGSNPVADQPARRSTQMKELHRRFAASESTPGEGRIELRPLTRPLLRYEDSATGVIDGAIFSFANGTNPEVLLILEAHKPKDRNPEWRFGLAQMTGAEVFVELDGEKIWNRREADPPAIRESYVNGWIAATPSP